MYMRLKQINIADFHIFYLFYFSLPEMRKSAQHMDNVPFSTSVDCDDINI